MGDGAGNEATGEIQQQLQVQMQQVETINNLMKNISDNCMSKNFYKAVSILVVLFAIGIPLTYSYIRGNRFDDRMKNNSVIVNGVIVNYKKSYKLADAFFYKFKYNGTIYNFESSASSSSNDYAQLSTYMIGKTVPVLVNISEPEKYSKALIVPEDFEEYGMAFPDSMKWVVRILDRR